MLSLEFLDSHCGLSPPLGLIYPLYTVEDTVGSTVLLGAHENVLILIFLKIRMKINIAIMKFNKCNLSHICFLSF